MLAQSYAPVVGGEERIVEDLSTELVGRGHEVVVATLEQPLGPPPEGPVPVSVLGSGLDRLPGMGGDPERRYAPPAPDPVTVRDLRRLVERFRPEVVHGHNWLADSYLPLAKRGDAAFVMSLHDYSLRCANKRFFLDGTVCSGPGALKCLQHANQQYGVARGAATAAGTALGNRWFRRRVDLFLPVSEAVRRLCALGDDEPSKVLPNFIGELPAPPADLSALDSLPDEPFILYFGDVTEDKGARVLVEAYGQIEGAPPLVLIGRPIVELPPTPGVVLMGRLPHALAIEALRRALFSVVPTILPETFGIVALEAGAAGKPVVASDVGGLPDVVVDGETGYLVPPGDPAPLCAAIERLLADPSLRSRMGEAARERVRQVFSPDAVVPMFEQAYEETIERRRVAP